MIGWIGAKLQRGDSVRRVQHAAAIVVCTLASSAFLQAQQQPSCVKTALMRIYSSAFVQKETGDILGYELGIKQNDDSSVNALLYVYEGAANDDGIPLSGRISGKNLAVQGDWVEQPRGISLEKGNHTNALHQNRRDA